MTREELLVGLEEMIEEARYSSERIDSLEKGFAVVCEDRDKWKKLATELGTQVELHKRPDHTYELKLVVSQELMALSKLPMEPVKFILAKAYKDFEQVIVGRAGR